MQNAFDVNLTPSLQTYTRTLAAGSEQTIDREATGFAVISATGVFKMSLGEIASEFNVEGGISYRSERPWNRTRLINETGAPITLEIALYKGDIRDSRVTIPSGQAIGIKAGDTASSDAATSCASGAATLLLAANADRREAIICNDDASATVYATFANSASKRGVKLAPGQTAVLSTTAAIYIYQDSGSAVDVMGSEIEA